MINNRKVLVVEPDKPMRRTLIGAISDLGLEVVAVSKFEEAVERLADRPAFGLIVTDLVGGDLHSVLREQGLSMPIVIFTAELPPRCFRALDGVKLFDKLGEAPKLMDYLRELAA